MQAVQIDFTDGQAAVVVIVLTLACFVAGWAVFAWSR